MSEENAKGIWIVTPASTAGEETDGSKGGWDTGPDFTEPEVLPSSRRRTFVRAEDLRAEMSVFLEVVEEIFNQAEEPKAKMRLDEIELSVEVNGEGKVSLLGMGGKAGGKGTINLKFKRQ